MTYIEYMNQLWRSALLSPLPASEIALFAYLVNESNKRYWKCRLRAPQQEYVKTCAFQGKLSSQHGSIYPSANLSLLQKENPAIYRPITHCLNGQIT